MTVKINPKLLDIVQVSGPPFKPGESGQGTIVELLGGPQEVVLVEVSDDQGIPLAFVPRRIDEVEPNPDREQSRGSTIRRCLRPSYILKKEYCFCKTAGQSKPKKNFPSAFHSTRYSGAVCSIRRMKNELPKGAFEPAIVVYTTLLELSPGYELARENFAITQMNRAIGFAQHGLFPQAIETFLKALALHPSQTTTQTIRNNIVATYTQLGLLYSNMNQYQLAFQCFQRAFELDPSEISKESGVLHW